jgi:hypothetical protein
VVVLGHFEGLKPLYLSLERFWNLQYIDDTLLFVKVDYDMVNKIKWALWAFEGLSGLEINFNKSELIALNIDPARAFNFSRQLNCKLGFLSLKYLGLTLHWK